MKVKRSECNVPPGSDESFLINGSYEQNSDTTVMDEETNNDAFSGRENVELYHEMLKSVGKMRSLINEMKRISGANAEYHIKDRQGEQKRFQRICSHEHVLENIYDSEVAIQNLKPIAIFFKPQQIAACRLSQLLGRRRLNVVLVVHDYADEQGIF
ncbi:hypothetical protein LOAG_14269 [Loa loa]|uniref:Uncharacterized protein n=1 Tax=Loa loa TaxID=7209 RepID=A0A1S0TIH9_LOALO|nr:hypothetical protein LOAG_14269 [Loa loa]EFO14254.1 hypothetical protein LOAG_14269 [Loa loa]